MWVRTYIAQLSATQAELLTETEHAALVTMATAEEHGETATLVHLSKGGGGGNARRGRFLPARKASRSQHVCSHVIEQRLCVDNSQLLYTTGSSPRHLYSRNSALRDGSCCDGGSDALCCGYPRLLRLPESSSVSYRVYLQMWGWWRALNTRVPAYNMFTHVIKSAVHGWFPGIAYIMSALHTLKIHKNYLLILSVFHLALCWSKSDLKQLDLKNSIFVFFSKPLNTYQSWFIYRREQLILRFLLVKSNNLTPPADTSTCF